MHFFKYQGTGNDFVMIDDRSVSFDLNDVALVSKLCNRRFGIGADGLILIRNHTDCDFEMIYFNADGSMSFCGNGSRCAVQFARDLGLIENSTTFLSTDGVHEAKVLSDGRISLKMHDVDEIYLINGNDFELNTGSPHYIRFVDDVENEDIISLGKTIRFSDHYKEKGINVNVVAELNPNVLKISTYERGVEDETLSCGTGVTAAAIAYADRHNKKGAIELQTKGGSLQVDFKRISTGKYNDIYLTGPAKFVFKGEWENG